jgi:hypothetical protein
MDLQIENYVSPNFLSSERDAQARDARPIISGSAERLVNTLAWILFIRKINIGFCARRKADGVAHCRSDGEILSLGPGIPLFEWRVST